MEAEWATLEAPSQQSRQKSYLVHSGFPVFSRVEVKAAMKLIGEGAHGEVSSPHLQSSELQFIVATEYCMFSCVKKR